MTGFGKNRVHRVEGGTMHSSEQRTGMIWLVYLEIIRQLQQHRQDTIAAQAKAV